MSLLSSSQGGSIDGVYTAVDCGSTTCEAIYEVLQTCIVYSEPKIPTALCVIPCQVSGCEQQVYHYINCAVWVCTEKTTPTPPLTTSNPPLPSSRSCGTAVCISSVSINAIFGILIMAFAGHWGRKTWLRRSQTAGYAQVDAGPLPSAPPAPGPVADSEFHEVPLMPRVQESPGERIPLKCFDSMRNFWSRRRNGTDDTTV